MTEAHFFDIDTLIKLEKQDAWVVDKQNPSKPLLKISKSDLRLMESGIWKSHGNKIEFSGRTFWLPTNIYNQIKIKCKVEGANLANLAISLQEFLNKDFINNLDFNLRLENIIHVKNKVEDIYIICSKQTERLYGDLIVKLEEKLREEGILIKKFYNITDKPMDWESDSVKYKKSRLLLQHLIGYKTDGDKFIDTELKKYTKINFYDVEWDTLSICKEINVLLNFLVDNTKSGLKDIIKEDVKEFNPQLTVNRVSDNAINRIESQSAILEIGKIVKKFENFNPKI
jgi:hypothetical protein